MKPLRSQFLLDPDIAFLNHGSFGACPAAVLQAQQQWQLQMERNPVEFLSRRSAQLLLQSRQALAQYLGARSEDLVYVSNATTGVNVVAASLKLQSGDEVLTTDHEYGACDLTWQRVCSAQGAHYRRVKIELPFDAGRFCETLLAAITPRTRVLFLSHLSSATALIFPLKELLREARRLGILTLVDGAHAPGQIPLALDELGADFYTGNCHKWMCAPKGAAFLHVRPEHHDRVHAPITSWGYGDEGSVAEAPRQAQRRYTGHSVLERRLQWQGTRDIAAWLSVPAALEFLREHDAPALARASHARAVALMHAWCAETGLAPIGADADFAQMVPLPLAPGLETGLQQHLFEAHRIEVPVTFHQGRHFVRVSVQGYNSDEELDRLLKALRAWQAPAP